MTEISKSHPDWIKVRYRPSKIIDEVEAFLKQYDINTVCSSALCPNRGYCFNERAMTFLLLGPNCTRGCKFCSVDKNPNAPYSDFEKDAYAILKAVEKFNLKYITLTSPTRDDLPDGGAFVFADIIKSLKRLDKPPKVEALIPDFRGNKESLLKVSEASPDVIAHNLETVPRLYKWVRIGADWSRSLDVLQYIRNKGSAIVKSALMVGLGETYEEILDSMNRAYDCGCEIMVIGQYLRPSREQMEVDRYVTPDEFERYENDGRKIGFKVIMAGPLYRSSYKAEEAYMEAKCNS